MLQPSYFPETERARSALQYIDPSCDRETWIRIGMALKELGSDGRKIWDEWSQGSEKYDERASESAWRSFDVDTRGVGIATLYHLAKQAGWDGKPVGVAEAQGWRALWVIWASAAI